LRYIDVAGNAVGFPHLKTVNKEITVASICAKCGAEVSSDNQTCLACGAPVAAAIPIAPAAAYTPVVVAAQPAPPPPAKSGSSVVKIILIVVLIFIGLGVLGAGAVGFWIWRIAHAVHVSGSGSNGQVQINTPGGSITANSDETYTAADLGVDIYPGATVAKGGMKMTMPTGSSVTAIFTTSDSKEQVESFYKSKLGSDATSMDFGPSAILTVKKGDTEQVTVTITSNSSESGGKTQIAISHTIVTKSS